MTTTSKFKYPPARRSDHVDEYQSETKGSVSVPDPYRWLETGGKETDEWIDAQVKLSRSFLDGHKHRKEFESDLLANVNYARCTAPKLKKDGRWYWTYNSGLQAQPVVYRSLDSVLPEFPKESNESPGEIFYDTNLLTEDGTASLTHAAFSHCGKYWAYAISFSGSDVQTLYVRSTDKPYRSDGSGGTKEDSDRMPQAIRIKFSEISWTHDSKGFFYQRFPSKQPAENGEIDTDEDTNPELCYHRINTSPEEDIIVMKDAEHPQYHWNGQVTGSNGRFLELYIDRDTSRKNKFWICDLSKNEIGPNMQWIKLVDEFEASYNAIHFAESSNMFYVNTNKDAPRHKLVSINISREPPTFKDVIAEDPEAILEQAVPVNKDTLVCSYLRNVMHELQLYSLSGKHITRIDEGSIGSINISSSGWDHPFFFANFVGFTSPGDVMRYDFREGAAIGEWSAWRETTLSRLELQDFSTKQIWYNSKDGTKIPMFIVKHNSTPQDGTAAALLYGYGGFSISVQPSFNSSILTFMKRFGVVYAVANIRGGSEFGEDWHEAGMKERKSNCFDDFIAAAAYLVEAKYAAKGAVAINGGSNGGLLVAACANRAEPSTIGAAVAQVGVLDMLRFDKFTIGKFWTSDYGDPQSPHDFDYIYPISPLHNIPKDKPLPPMLLQTADHDDRVVPLHSFKYAATMQYMAKENPHPLLISIDRKAGHGAGKGTIQKVQEQADKFVFIAEVMDLQWRN